MAQAIIAFLALIATVRAAHGAGMARRALTGTAAGADAATNTAAAHARELLAAPTCQQNLTAARSQLATAQANNRALAAKLAAAQSVAAQLKAANTKLAGDGSNSTDACSSLRMQLDTAQAELGTYKQQLAATRQQLQVTDGLLSSTQATLDRVAADLSATREAADQAKVEASDLRGEWEYTKEVLEGCRLTAAQAAQQAALLQEGLSECQANRFDGTAELADCSNKLIELQLANETNANALGECRSNLTGVESQYQDCLRRAASSR